MAKTQLEVLNEKIAAIETKLTTCSGEECKLLAQVLEQLKSQDARITSLSESLPKTMKETIDGGFAPYDTRWKELTEKVNPATPPIPETAYFTCPEKGCDGILDYALDECPKCGAPVDWPSTLEPMIEEATKRRASKE
jgi:hypothetical protein